MAGRRMMSKRYPWARWFARSPFRLVQGKHYEPSVPTYLMAQMVRNAAYRGMDGMVPCKVRILIAKDQRSLTVTVIPPRSLHAAAPIETAPTPPVPGD